MILLLALKALIQAVEGIQDKYMWYLVASFFTSPLELSTLDGSNGFVINGIAADGYAGYSVSLARDINDDSKVDLVIGAPYASLGGRSSAGQAYLVYAGVLAVNNLLRLLLPPPWLLLQTLL